MSGTQMSNEQATRIPGAGMVDMKLDVLVHPVSATRPRPPRRSSRPWTELGRGLTLRSPVNEGIGLSGDREAQDWLALVYGNVRLVAKDSEHSFSWLSKSAEEGYAPAHVSFHILR